MAGNNQSREQPVPAISTRIGSRSIPVHGERLRAAVTLVSRRGVRFSNRQLLPVRSFWATGTRYHAGALQGNNTPLL
ncbi:hypothetical protein SAMN04487894_11930 [Niabella drilacis]|uniref:Uncharacterized protein n=1 Tax=Niabella drilacis (strain DSM 25811 / CCM 8410 / CCUG 62505 / LMG 26954 / E90) TaxID=1285928 RepID=A0A1G6ZTA4_NIADE|nr:hypothetical protein SAMN04487894_11930 [Niabella drilacis]